MRGFNTIMGERLGRAARRWMAEIRGSAAVEFALVTPVLIGLLVPVIDFGTYIYDKMQLQLAVQAGAEYAARNGWDPTAIPNAIVAAVPSLHLTTANNVRPQPFDTAHVEFCGCASGTTITPAQCIDPNTNQRNTCPNSNPPVLVGIYMNLGVQMQYSSLITYPGISNPQTVSANAVFRFQ